MNLPVSPSPPLWHELNNRHTGGQMAVIVGKGPSLDAWLAAGCPRPDCPHAVIGVNHAGARFPFVADYHVSGHKFPEFAQIPGTWVVGVNSQDSRQDQHWDLPDYAAHWFLVTYGGRCRDYTRAQIARTRRLFHQTSSAQLALHFAWYLGFESVQFIGIDGGSTHAQAMQGVPGVTAPNPDYDRLKQHTHALADRLFPGRWWHWNPDKTPPAPVPVPAWPPVMAQTHADIRTREDLARRLFQGIGAELGVAAAAFSDFILSDNRLVTRLYSIDRWTDHHDTREMHTALERLRRFGSNSCVMRAPFADACRLFDDASFDFLYLDGYAHTGQEGGQTLRDWWPKLNPGGILAGHDYSPKYPPTIAAVDAFVREHGLTLNLTTHDDLPSWWVVKPATS